jgi:hypothetical protein
MNRQPKHIICMCKIVRFVIKAAFLIFAAPHAHLSNCGTFFLITRPTCESRELLPGNSLSMANTAARLIYWQCNRDWRITWPTCELRELVPGNWLSMSNTAALFIYCKRNRDLRITQPTCELRESVPGNWLSMSNKAALFISLQHNRDLLRNYFNYF